MQLSVVDSEASVSYLRIASISIAFYDYILTLPAEWRFYRSQTSIFHLSLSCILFILIRYVSVLTMILSNYGFFSTTFTDETCEHYFLVAPVFKVIQIMVSQVIVGVRTFNIAKRDKRIGIFLLVLYTISVGLEWFTNIFARYPVEINGNCSSANSGKTLSAWIYYLNAMIYDLIMLTISTSYLLRYSPLSTRIEQLIRVLIYDGIGYFVALTGTNAFNLILYHTTDLETQTAGASLGYAVTWIMSQRILIHLRDMNDPDIRRMENVVLARPPRNAISAFRSQFDSKGPIDAEFASTTTRNMRPNDVEMDIQVCVERTMVVDYDDYERSSSCEKPMGEGI